MSIQSRYGLAIAGGGPAGIAVLLAAHRDGTLGELLDRGVLIVERGPSIGGGLIGRYCINSDSTGNAFVDPLHAGDEDAIHRVLETPVGRRVASAGPNTVALKDAGEMLSLVGEAMAAIIRRHPRSNVATGCTIQSAQLLPNGGWNLSLCDDLGTMHSVHAGNLVLATGASQPVDRLARERFAGMPLVERWGGRLLQSSDVFGPGGLDRVSEKLRGLDRPSVAILGGSTSAMALACALLNRLPDVHFREGGITLFHRRPLRVYYVTAQDAQADGYTEFGPDDICPLTKRVYRLAGMRLDSRELLMQLRGIGGRPPEPRMTLHHLQDP
ncbi:MAG TPA: aminotransferase DegT, partial [Acidisoma sp.]|nr:aminotransferase DegT [Acidisoma sp.]